MPFTKILNSIHQPGYTGKQRCWPCTSVNAVIILIATISIGKVWLPLGALVAISGTSAVAFRGYAVPYTPQFTSYIAAYFSHKWKNDPSPKQTLDSLNKLESGTGEGVLLLLLEEDILFEDEQGNLYLDETFREQWRAEANDLAAAESTDLAMAVAAAVPFKADGRMEYSSIIVEGEGKKEVVALERPHAIVEAAAMRVLELYGISAKLRAAVATSLRMFIERCPNCGGDIIETTQANCCGGIRNGDITEIDDVLGCKSCGEIYYRFESSGDDVIDD